MIVQLIQLFLALANNLAGYAKDKQLMDAGAAESVLKGVQDATEAIARANAARSGKLPDFKSDPNNRDNDKSGL